MKKTTLLSLFLLLISFNLFSQAGSLDQSFGNGGVTTTDVSNDSYDVIYDIAIQTDGKIVTAGTSNSMTVIARYNTDGSLDNSFGKNGLIKVSINSSLPLAEAFSIKIQSDGKIIAGITGYDSVYENADFVIARFLSNGSVDNSFGINGLVINDVSHLNNELREILIQPDGKIIAAGRSDSLLNEEPYLFFWSTMVRYNANGTIDKTFGDAGIVNTPVRKNYTVIGPVADLASTGKIVMAFYGQRASIGSAYDAVVISYKNNGSIDSSFGNNGIGVYGTPDDDVSVGDIKTLPDNKILLCGGYSKNLSLIRFSMLKINADGSLDNTFGSGGVVKTKLGKGDVGSNAGSMAIQHDGKIILGGYLSLYPKARMALARYNSNGGIDSTFGENGLAYVGNDYNNSGARVIAMQSDGKIIAAGDNIPNTSYYPDFIVARFNGDNNAVINSLNEKNNASNTNKKISLYPNPVSNILTVTGLNHHGSTIVSIIDNNGKLVTKTVAINQSSYTINTSNLKPGIYFLQLKENDKITTLKFLKQ